MTLILYFAALICFLIATFPVPVRINLVALGLALLTVTLVMGAVGR